VPLSITVKWASLPTKRFSGLVSYCASNDRK
jgi:hypothetical protein